MTKAELFYMSKPPLRYGRDKVWEKAFKIYNDDHPNERPLILNCIQCYPKVYFYCKKKYELQPE